MSKETLTLCVEISGGQVALAARLSGVMNRKINQQHVWKWLNDLKGDTPPADYVLPLARAVEFQVTPHQLRPDIYPHPQDGLPREEIAA